MRSEGRGGRTIRRREGSPMMGVKRSAAVRPRGLGAPFVCRGVSPAGPFVSSVRGGRKYSRSLRGPTTWQTQAARYHEYARCARQLFALNYLVRVSLFIEYRGCLYIFLRRACVPR